MILTKKLIDDTLGLADKEITAKPIFIHIREMLKMKENPKPIINFSTLSIDDHAVKRAKERFGKTDKNSAMQFCKCALGRAKYIGETTCEKGHRSHMFSDNKIAIILSLDLNKIVTVYKVKDREYIVKTEQDNPLHKKLTRIYEVEFRKHDRLEKSKERLLEKAKIEFGIEIATLKHRSYKTRSISVRNACVARINAISSYIGEFESQLKEVQDNKRKIAKAMACI